jgi:hypothetical protein
MCFANMGGAGAATSGSTSLLGGGGGATGLIGAGINALGQAKSSELSAAGQKTELANQAYVANMNAALSELQAQDALRQGTLAGLDVRQRAKQVKGAQRAAFAANGVKVDEGSPAAVQRSTEYLRDVDVATLANNAARAAFGYRVQKANQQARGGAYAAGADQISPGGAAATSLLTSAPSIAEKWYRLYGAQGIPPAASGGGRGTYVSDFAYPDSE